MQYDHWLMPASQRVRFMGCFRVVQSAVEHCTTQGTDLIPGIAPIPH